MAIKNKVWRIGDFVPVGAEPGLTRPFVWRDIDQEKATGDIARTRFDFPNIQQPTLKTFTNRPARQVGVRIDENEREMAFPDIVVLQDPSNEVSMIAEVETDRGLREIPEADLVEKWRTFAGLGALYLFVPLMRLDQVRGTIKRHKIAVEGIRTWRYLAGQDRIITVDV